MSDTTRGMPAPGPEHERLKPFEGRFRARVKIRMGPGDPQVSTGTMCNTWELGGLYLSQDYQGDENDGPFPSFVGRGYWGYNKVTEKYEGFWIDNASTIMQIETGDVDAAGRTWTMLGQVPNPGTGHPVKKRSVITLQDENHHRMDTYFAGEDGTEFKAIEIEYTRE